MTQAHPCLCEICLAARDAELARARVEWENLAFGCYLGLHVLGTMCRKVNLTLAEAKAKEIMAELDAAFPGFAARSALR